LTAFEAERFVTRDILRTETRIGNSTFNASMLQEGSRKMGLRDGSVPTSDSQADRRRHDLAALAA
jgi:hypothetical protein